MLWGWGQGSSELCLGDRDSWSYMLRGLGYLDQSCQFGKCWLIFGTTLILDKASSIRKLMSRAWNTANWTPAGGSITSLWYVCMYVCMSVTKTSSIFSKSAPTISISITNLMLKVTCQLMHWVPLFGPLGPLGKAYQMTGTVSIWYISSGVMPKNWADDVIIWDNSAGSKNSMGQVHHTVILRLNAQAHGPWAYFRLLTRWFIEIALLCCFTRS